MVEEEVTVIDHKVQEVSDYVASYENNNNKEIGVNSKINQK